MRGHNPFVPRHKTLQYITGSQARTLYGYRGMTIEVTRGDQRPDGSWWWSWRVSDDQRNPPIQHSGEGAMDENAAAILARYAGDLELAMRELGLEGEDTPGWHLGNMFQLLAGPIYEAALAQMPMIDIPHRTAGRGTERVRKLPGRAELSRALRVEAGRDGGALPEEWQRAAYDWYQNQSIDYRTQLIDRAIDVRGLKAYGIDRKPKRPSIPRGWTYPNPGRRSRRGVAVNPTTLKKRCLR